MKKRGSAALFRSGWMILAVVLLVATLLSTNWYYYRRTKHSLDEEFDVRLRMIANEVAEKIMPAEIELRDPGTIKPSREDTLLTRLLTVSSGYSLSNILVVREDGITLVSLQPGIYPPGEDYPNWDMDYEAIISALEGTPAATELYRAPDGTYMKAGYAPVPLTAEPAVAFVAVEASVDFLKGLRELRSILIAFTAISVLGVGLFTWFVFKATGSLIKARESLAHAETLASMGRMASGIAHEIRNPLFIIRSSAEKIRAVHPESAGEIEEFILEEVDRLNRTLTDYLLFSRNEPAPKHPMDLVATLRRSVRLVRESLEMQAIEIRERYELDEAPFHGEEKRLQQSFLNILLNAEQSIPDSGSIDVSIGSGGDHYVIGFDDTGSGIAEKQLQQVFEPFYTTKPAGSGLGLAVVKKVTEDHDGRIDIRSRAGEGTRIRIFLPVAVKPTGETQ